VKDAIKEVTEVGTERGMNNWYNSLVKQRNDGTFTPMAFHPGGGGRAGGWLTGIAFGWIGSTIAFGDVVRKP
jgi:hypothetical protein